MSKSVFISYRYEDQASRKQVEHWAQEGKLGPEVVTTAESEDLRPQGEAAIVRHLEPKIRGAAAVVCLIGQNSHNDGGWVQYELDVATSLHKVIVLLRIPGTTGAAPPRHQHHPCYELSASTLRELI